ncbi:ABC transporter ATP-binding protein [Actinomadura macrotermitis]|uniref:Oligopeptide transport ATP-binding protein OppD n=1 Tax=Actinomadura macrotermitis TaxID=2585200 RepID=A0A7K0BNP6_9ACTN|nr:ABC transporter ATP-binding protein [Actinomadura macrotermitis]MQY02686.1 Oligopeptide transport ATP-binding protein OppD [Actinomadura macrotermitis]
MIEIEKLRIDFGGAPVVDGVSLAVAPGERVGLIGESGSGKSLTALAVLGLLPPGARAAGRVAIDGTDVLGLPERRLARLRGDRVAMVFQEPMTALDPVMRVGRQLALVSSKARARELLELVGLPADTYRAYPHQLSGGQRQRIVLAIALARDPAVLICDEPTTALDVRVQARVLDLIDGLAAERGAGLLFVSHDLAVVSNLCSRVLVMRAGRVVESGPVAEVLAAPRHEYTAALLAASDLEART